MANEQNLIPNSARTPDELREMARKGGVKSGEVRRERRLLKDYAEWYLSQPADKRKFGKEDIPDDMKDNKMLLIMALHKKALGGDVLAFRELRNLIGEDAAIAPGQDNENDNLFEAIAEAVKEKMNDGV